MTIDHQWSWLRNKWQPIAYRTQKVILDVLRDGRWHPFGDGSSLRFQRMIETGQFPFDREVVEVHFDMMGRLKGWSRHKVIQIDKGRSHDSLREVLGVDGPLGTIEEGE